MRCLRSDIINDEGTLTQLAYEFGSESQKVALSRRWSNVSSLQVECSDSYPLIF